MEMYKALMAYIDSNDLSKLQKEWDALESHKFKQGVFVDDLIESWEGHQWSLDLEKIKKPEKINIPNQKAPNYMELFYCN